MIATFHIKFNILNPTTGDDNSCILGSYTADGVTNLLENLNIKENIKDDSLHLDIETALESLKFQVELLVIYGSFFKYLDSFYL